MQKNNKTYEAKKIKVDCVIMSPPYKTSRNVRTERGLKERETKYKMYKDSKPFEEYVYFITDVIRQFDDILGKNGTIIMNMSYAHDIVTHMTCSRLIELLHYIITQTDFDIADIICWKKNSALPNNRSKNKCTRICEFIFILCRKEEYTTFKSNKKVTTTTEKGSKYYSNMFNFVEAVNNDGKNPYNNATYSTELVHKILEMYVQDNSIVYDCFAGTCTTAVACCNENRGIRCICSEIDKEQCEYGLERIKNGKFF